jgi:hypothetical protein
VLAKDFLDLDEPTALADPEAKAQAFTPPISGQVKHSVW